MTSQLREVIAHGPVHFVELFTALFAVIWGLSLLSGVPGPTWGVGCAILGLIQFWGIKTSCHRVRRFATRGLSMYWSFVGALVTTTDWHFVAAVIYSSLAVICLWVGWRLGPTRHNRRVTEHDAVISK